jgi:hypothetical protein
MQLMNGKSFSPDPQRYTIHSQVKTEHRGATVAQLHAAHLQIAIDRVAESALQLVGRVLEAEDGPLGGRVGFRVIPDIKVAILAPLDAVFKSLCLVVSGEGVGDVDPNELGPHVVQDLIFCRLGAERNGKVRHDMRSIERLRTPKPQQVITDQSQTIRRASGQSRRRSAIYLCSLSVDAGFLIDEVLQRQDTKNEQQQKRRD